MKKLLIIIVAIILALAAVTPALAVSLGVSPSHVELEVPADGIGLADVQIHYFSGDVEVSLVDIPLRVEPTLLHVDEDPQDFQITIYGDESLGSQVYEGYIRFLGLSGETVAVAVRIKATITNLVPGQPLPTPEAAEPALMSTTSQSPEGNVAGASSAPPSSTEDHSGWLGGIEGMSTNLVIIIAAAVVFLGLIILAVVMISRRRLRYY